MRRLGLSPRLYVSPTEPKPLHLIGRVSSLPEQMGCDFLAYIFQPYQCIGFQRKELSDLVISLQDGRLAKQLGQMNSSESLTTACLIVEGHPTWTNEDQLVSTPSLSRRAYRSLLNDIQAKGVYVQHSDSIPDTIDLIHGLVAHYANAQSHNTLDRRPKSPLKDSWGIATSSAFASHLLQSFPGCGPRMAENIYTTFGRIPLRWEVSEEDLLKVPGIGKQMAKRLIGSLS